MGIQRVGAVLMAIVLLLAPLFGAVGTVGATTQPGPDRSTQAVSDSTVVQQASNPSLTGNFINATASVDVWDRAIFPLRTDRSDSAVTATSVDNIYTEASAPGKGASPLQSPSNRNLVVYPDDATIDITFDVAGKTDASASSLDGEEITLISAKAESSDNPEIPSAIDIQSLRNFVQNESNNENVIFENVTTTTVKNNGAANFQYDLSAPSKSRGAGTYTFMAVTTSGEGINVTDSNISVPGEATILGVDTAVVQQTSSQLSVDTTKEVGDTISFDVNANVSTSQSRVEHAVALWNESAVAGERLTIVAPDTVTADTTVSEFTVNHTIKSVSGVQNNKDDVSAFGRTLNQNKRSGVFELADIVTFIANGGNFSEPQTNRVGNTTINASMTSVNATSPNTTIDVETLDSFEPGQYVAVHMAMADGNLTKVSSQQTTITLSEPGQLAQFNVSVATTNSPVQAGDPLTITAGVANTGNLSGTQQITLTDSNGTTVGSANVTLSAGESTTQAFTVPTTANDTGANQTFTIASDDTSQTVDVTVGGPNLNITTLNTTGVGNAGESFTANVTIKNEGILDGTQNVTLNFDGETVFDREVSVGSGATQTVSATIPTTTNDDGARTIIASTDDSTVAKTVTLGVRPTFEVDVIESESKLDVVAGQNVTVLAEVTNVGSTTATKSVNLTNVTNGSTTQVESQDIVLNASEQKDFTAEVQTDDTTPNTLAFNLSTPDDAEEFTATVADAETFFDVSIDNVSPTRIDEPDSGATTPVTVNATITNLGNSEATQTISVTKNGEVVANQDVTLSGSNSTTINETVDVVLGDAPEVTIGVESQNESDSRAVTVDPNAEFDVSIVSASNVTQPVPDDSGFAPTINVTNTGSQSGDGSVEVFFNGTSEKNFSVSGLNASDTRTIVEPNSGFEINVSNVSTGPKLLEAEVTNNKTGVSDDLSSEKVVVGNASTFAIDSFTVNKSTVSPGDAVAFTATVNNTGGITGEKPVTFEFGGRELLVEDTNLSSGNTQTVATTFTPRVSDVGANTVVASTPDEESSTTVTVREPATFEADLSVSDTAIANDTLTATVSVRNAGGNASNNQTVRLLADGEEVANDSVTVTGGQTQPVTLSYTPTQQGDVEILAVTNDDTDSETVSVGQPGTLNVTLRSITNPVTTNGTVDAVASISNVGDGSVSGEEVSFVFDGISRDSTTVSLAGGATTQVTLSHAITRSLSAGSTVSVGASVVSNDDTEATTVTIEEPPSDASFRTRRLDAPASVLNTSQNVTVTANVTNAGGQQGTQDINFTIGDVSNTSSSVSIPSEQTESVQFDFDPTAVGSTGEVSYTVSTDNQTATDTITIEEPVVGTPVIDSVSFPEDQATQTDAFTADVTIENTGDLALDGNRTVNITYNGQTQATSNASINASGTVKPGATETVTVSVTPAAEQRAGVFDREVNITTGGFGTVNQDSVTETVPVDFEGIQSGVDAVSVRDTNKDVLVAPGSYEARNTITVGTRGITIKPSASGTVPEITKPRRSTTALEITADQVTIESLGFTGSGSGTAIVVNGPSSSSVELTDLQIEDWSTGVRETTGTNTFTGLDVQSTDQGIVLNGGGKTSVNYTQVGSASKTGILAESDQNTIFGTTVTGSPIGVDMFGRETTVAESTVRGADEYGLRVTDVPGTLGGTPSATGTNNVIESNSLGVLVDSSNVSMSGNWWGTPSPEDGVDYAARSGIGTDPSQTRLESNFTVSTGTRVSTGDNLVRDTTFSVDVTVKNTGTKSDRQTIELTDSGTAIASQAVELNGGEEKTIRLQYTPDVTDGSSLTLGVRSLDQTASDPGTVNIVDPASLSIQSISTEAGAPLGTPLTVDVTVDNTGGVDGDAAVTLNDGVSTTQKTQTVLAGNNTTISFTPSTNGFGTGTQALTVKLRDAGSTLLETQTPTATIDPAELSSIGLSLGENTVELGSTTTATVTETKTDGSTADVTSRANTTLKSSDTAVATINGTDVVADGTGSATITAKYGADGKTRTDTESVTVEDTTSEPTTTSSSSGGGGGGVSGQVSPPASTEGLDVTQSESKRPTLDVATNRRVAEFDSLENVRSIAFETSDRIDDVTVSEVNPDSIDTPGAGIAVQDISVPSENEDTAATIEFTVSRDRIEAASADVDDLRVLRGVGGGYETLPTSVEDTGEDSITLTAETPGFSIFTVSAVSEPEAVATVTPETATVGEEIEFSGAESTDQYGEIVAYEWSIDGETFSGETVTTAVETAGTTDAELTVTNDAGETATTTVSVTVEQAETEEVSEPTGEQAEPPEEESGTEDGIPGFGALLAVVSLLAAALLAARRQDR